MIATAAPQPQAREAYEQYVTRAHRELMQAIPEPEQRNRVVWDAWAAAYGDPERDRATVKFSADRFDCRRDVCYFSEHETARTGPDGQPVVQRYDIGKLAAIMRENNHRIEDRDAYPTLVDRHTAPAGHRDPAPPRTLGGVGPFRLGMIGRKEPKFALFADEYTRKDAAADLADRPGRSVEVLTLKANGRTYINPIAAISEAPRLPLPLQFSAEASHEGEVERYSMLAPVSALPGGGNTHLQQFDATSDPPDTSAGGESPSSQSPSPNQEPGSMPLTEQDVRQLVDAVLSTPPMQWVQQQMQQQGGGGAPPAGPPSPAPSPAGPPQQDNYGGPQRFGADHDPDLEVEEPPVLERYHAMAASQREMINELADARERLFGLERERSDAQRREQLRDLQGRFPHAVDLEHEFNRCLYSCGSKLDDDGFDQHLADIEHYAARQMPVTPMIPSGMMPAGHNDRESAQYAAQETAEVRRLTNHYANQGVVKTFAELKTEAKQILSAGA